MNQFKPNDLIVALPGRGHTNKLCRVDQIFSEAFIAVDFGGVVRLVDAIDFRLATPEEILFTGRRIEEGEVLPVDDEFLPDDSSLDIIDLPFAAGLGAEGTYGMTDKQLEKHQEDSLGRHDRMCRNLIIIALLLVAAIAGMNWWVA